jgi:hypothetical protein
MELIAAWNPVFGWVVFVILVAPPVVYGLWGIFTRTDIGWGRKVGWLIAIIISVGLVAIFYGVWDLLTRTDIGWAQKALWLIAFIVTLGLVAFLYGFVELSRSSLMAGQSPAPRGS